MIFDDEKETGFKLLERLPFLGSGNRSRSQTPFKLIPDLALAMRIIYRLSGNSYSRSCRESASHGIASEFLSIMTITRLRAADERW